MYNDQKGAQNVNSFDPFSGDYDSEAEIDNLLSSAIDTVSEIGSGPITPFNPFEGDMPFTGDIVSAFPSKGQGEPAKVASTAKKIMPANPKGILDAASLISKANAVNRIASGKTGREAPVKFLNIKGATIEVAPIDKNAGFQAAELEFVQQRIFTEAPRLSVVQTAIPVLGVCTFQPINTDIIPGSIVVESVPFFVLSIGGPALTSVPKSVVTIDLVFNSRLNPAIIIPQITVIIEANAAYSFTLYLTPWDIVGSKPVLAQNFLPLVADIGDFEIVVSNLDANARATLILPGIDHSVVTKLYSSVR